MPTLDYIAQPGMTLSHMKLLATDLLLILENDSSQKIPNRFLNRKEKILHKGMEYLRSLHKGFDTSRYGTHSVISHDSIRIYKELSNCLDSEASCADFPVQVDGYCNTLEACASGNQPPSEEINKVKSFFSRVLMALEKKESLQPSIESRLQGLSYISL